MESMNKYFVYMTDFGVNGEPDEHTALALETWEGVLVDFEKAYSCWDMVHGILKEDQESEDWDGIKRGVTVGCLDKEEDRQLAEELGLLNPKLAIEVQ